MRSGGVPGRPAEGTGRGRESYLALYFRRLRDEVGLKEAEALRRAEVWLERVRLLDPDFAATVEGIAEGSGFPLPAVAALSARYELFYSEFASRGLATSCTACAVLPERTGGGLLLAQNWDWFPEVRGLWVRSTGGTSRSSPSPRPGSRRGRPGSTPPGWPSP